VEHEVDVALDDVTEGWVAVKRKVALPPPPRRAVRRIRLLHQVSSSGARDPAPPSGPPSSVASSCSSKFPPAQAPPSLSPTTHLRPRPLRKVPRAMARRQRRAPQAHGGRPNLEGHVELRGGFGLKQRQRRLQSEARQRWCSAVARSMWRSRR
jgi:hypothetical protein